MSVVVNEVITEFGFRGDESRLDTYNDALSDSIGLLVKTAAATAAAAAAVTAFTLATTQSLDPLIQMTRRTGLAIETVQELGYVASVNGSNAEAMYSTLEGLSATIGDAARYGSEEFSRLGINVRHANGEIKAADELLLEVGERLRSMDISQQEQLAIAQRLGIDASLLQTLRLSGAEMDSLREKARSLGVVTKEQADAAASLNDSYTTLKFGVSALQNSLAVGLAPQIESVIAVVIDFIEANRELISDGLGRVIEIVLATVEAIGRLMPFIVGIAAAFGVWKLASVGIGAILGTIFSPVYLITAAIVALALVVDDLIVAFNGGESAIANFFQEVFGIDIVPYLESIVATAEAMVAGLINALSASFDAIRSLISAVIALVTGDFDGFVSHIKDYVASTIEVFTTLFAVPMEQLSALGRIILDALGTAFDAVVAFLTSVGTQVADIASGIVSAIVDPIREGLETLIGWIEAGLSKIGGIVSSVAKYIPFFGDDEEDAPAGSAAAQNRLTGMESLRPQPVVNNTNTQGARSVQQDVKIEIRTDDPRSAGDSVRYGLNQQLEDAEAQLNSGGF